VEPERVEREPDRDVAVVRGWLAGAAAFVITFLVVRWVMREVWPAQDDLSEVGTDLLRVGTSVAVATAAALAVALWAGRRRD
jgi:hypothetical protein